MSYPLVNIQNSTNYSASGTVDYVSWLCSNDNWGAGPGQSWQANSRGACLVEGISASVSVNGSTIEATPYGSSGTSYSQFALIQTGSNPPTFEVTRRASGAEDARPEDYEEPTTQQKQ